MHKQGQINYEYIIVIGMVLVLLIPFTYSFSLGFTGKADVQSNQDALTRLAHGVETAANLGGWTTALKVPVRLGQIMSSTANGEPTFSFLSSKGDTYSASVSDALRIYGGYNSLAGTGLQHFSVVNSLRPGSVVVGNAPAIVALCRPATVSYSQIATAVAPDCVDDKDDYFAVRPNEDVLIVGANFQDLRVAGIKKIPPVPIFNCGNPGACMSDADCPPLGGSGYGHCFTSSCTCATQEAPTIQGGMLPGQERYIIYLNQPATGAGSYYVGVSTDNGRTLTWTINFDPNVTPPGEEEEEGEGTI